MIRGIKNYFRILGVNGLLKAIIAETTNTTVSFEINRKDCLHPFLLRVPSTDALTYEQVFMQQEYDFLVNTPPQVIVDAGANIGLASIYFTNKYADARIIAIEPEQGNFDMLKRNVASYPNITPVQAALWHENQEINLVDPGIGAWGFMTKTKNVSDALSGQSGQAVLGITIDKIMADYQLEKIDILKIDIEGAEKEVFSDSRAWINKVESIIIELHERLKAGCNRSFYYGTNGFDNEWTQGENMYLSKGQRLVKK